MDVHQFDVTGVLIGLNAFTLESRRRWIRRFNVALPRGPHASCLGRL